MNSAKTQNPQSRYFGLRHYLIALIVGWTLIVSILLGLNITQAQSAWQESVTNEASAYFLKDQAFRLWSTSHGGVYVPTDERTPPNPYLEHVSERDIETPSGVQLTLMNPAYMMRQMNEEFAEMYGIPGRITSLDPLRPQNGPDEWEREALETFEQGEAEALEFTEIDGEPYLRLMRPMITQEGCLKCHGYQDYEVGDIRGGVGVSMPLASSLVYRNQRMLTDVLSLGLVWALGLGGIGIGAYRLGQQIVDREQKTLYDSEERFRTLVEQSPIAALICAADGTVLETNKANEKLWDIPRESLIGKFNVLDEPQATLTGVRPYFEKALAGEFQLPPEKKTRPQRSWPSWSSTLGAYTHLPASISK